MLVEILALLAIFFLFLLALVPLSLVLSWVISEHLGVPFVRTPTKVFAQITDALDISDGDVVYELGSGDGGFLLHCAKRFPAASFVGVELNPLLYAYSRGRFRLHGSPKNLSFRKKDLFESDFSNANKIYAYLLTPFMDKLLLLLERDFKSGRFVSRAFQFTEKKASRVVELSKKPGWHGQHLLYVYDF